LGTVLEECAAGGGSLRRLTRTFNYTLLMLTPLTQTADKIVGLKLGADDYC